MEPVLHYLETNGVRLHVAAAGPESGPLLVLLHGFPEFWFAWREHMAPLAAAGYRVIAPDQRGYNLSEKPRRVEDYGIDTLARDVVGLIDALGRDKAFVVGHDWGGAVAWWVAHAHPERVERAAVINCPHPQVLKRMVASHPRQLGRSWYIGFFQIPGLPERLLSADGHRRAVDTLLDSSVPGTFSPEEIANYRRAWDQPRAWTSMIHWYRAALRHPPPPAASPRVSVPLLLIWGDRDAFLGLELTRPSLAMCDDGRLDVIEGATHWVHHEQRTRVCESLKAFFAG